jgi:PII-like signaling protein
MNEVDVTVVRIYLHEREPRLKNIMQVLHDELHVRGVTAFRGIAGFGASGQWHASGVVDLSLDLPIVVEFFDEPEKARRALERLTAMCKPGHIVEWAAKATVP